MKSGLSIMRAMSDSHSDSKDDDTGHQNAFNRVGPRCERGSQSLCTVFLFTVMTFSSKFDRDTYCYSTSNGRVQKYTGIRHGFA